MVVCAGTHVSCYCNTHATQLASHSATHPGKTLKAPDGASRLEVWELTIGVSGKLSELRLRCSCGRRLRGMSWAQARRAEQTFTTLFKHDKLLETKGLHAARGMLFVSATASCCTQERRYRAGLVESPLCPRREEENEDMYHRVCQCRANTGEIFDKTQHPCSQSHTSQSHSRMFPAQGPGSTILDFARHEVGFLASLWEWRIDRSLYIHLCGSGAWDGLQSLFRVCQTVLGKPWNVGHRTVRGL